MQCGKKILTNSFIANLNNFSLEKYAHHPPISLSLRRTSSLTTDLPILHHERLKHKNGMIDYFEYK